MRTACSTVQLAALYLCLSVLVAEGSHEALRVPQILHRNFMAGTKALYEAAHDPQSGFKAHWLASCQVHNPEWQEIIWDAAAVRSLIEQDFPWFLQTYLSYPKLVQRSDVARYMLLYKYGGVYLDADVECYGPLESTLLNKDLVLNCEWPQKQAQIHNAAMASAPGHPFWLAVLHEAMQRAPYKAAYSTAGLQLHRRDSKVGPAERGPPAVMVSDAESALDEGSSSISSSRDNSHSSTIGGSRSRVTVAGLLSKVSIQAIVQGLKGLDSILQWYSRQLKATFQGIWEMTPFHDKVNAVLWSTGPMLLTDVYKRYTGSVDLCGVSVEVAGLNNHVYELGSWFTPCFFRDMDCYRRWITQHFLITRNQSQQHEQQQQQQSVVGIHHYAASWTDWDKSGKQQEDELALEASQYIWEFLIGPLFLEYNCSEPLLLPHTAASSGSSNGGTSTSGSSSSSVEDAVIPLCMELLLDSASTGRCTVVTLIGGGEQQQQQQAGSDPCREAAEAAVNTDRIPSPAAAATAAAAEGGGDECVMAGIAESPDAVIIVTSAAGGAAATGGGGKTEDTDDCLSASSAQKGVFPVSSSNEGGGSSSSRDGSSGSGGSSDSGGSTTGGSSSSSSRGGSCAISQAEQNESSRSGSARDSQAASHRHCTAPAAAAAGTTHDLDHSGSDLVVRNLGFKTEQVLQKLGCDVTVLSEYLSTDLAPVASVTAAAAAAAAAAKSGVKDSGQQRTYERGSWRQLRGSLGLRLGSEADKQQSVSQQQQQQQQQEEEEQQQQQREVEQGSEAAANAKVTLNAHDGPGSAVSVGVVTLQELLKLAEGRKLLRDGQQQQQQQHEVIGNARISSGIPKESTSAVPEGVVTPQDLLRLARDDQQQQQQQQQQEGSSKQKRSNTSTVHHESSTRFVLRVVTNICDLRDLLQAPTYNNGTPATLATPLHQVVVLVLDLTFPSTWCSNDLAEVFDKCKINDNPRRTNAKNCGKATIPMKQEDACSIIAAGDGGSVQHRFADLAGLWDLYNILYQQHGFVGFHRQQLSDRVFRLAWVRQP